GGREVLVDAPRRGAVVEERVVHAAAVRAEGVGRAACAIAGADGDVLDDHVVGLHGQAATHECDAGIRRGLSGDRQLRLANGERLAGKIDDAAHLEHHQPGPTRLDRSAKGTRTVRVEIGDAQHGNWFYQ